MTTTTRLVGLLTVAAAVAAGCSGGGDTAAVATSVPVTATTLPPTTTVAPTTTTTTVAPTTTTTFPTDVPRMTLTGEPIADAAVVPDRPALAVKISNYPSSVLPQAEQTVQVARAAYESDRGSFLALIDSQRVLLDARLDYYRARAERAQAIADLERVVGIDLTTTASTSIPGRHLP